MKPQKHRDRYTYGEYLQFPTDERLEILEGAPVSMSPAPSPEHQRVCAQLTRQIANQLDGRPCEVYPAPFDVRLPQAGEADQEIDTVVQPDISVVCESRKIDERGCRGAPDLVIEVLSPATAPTDCIAKRDLYERHGVKEYWLVHPVDRLITLLRLSSVGRYGFPEIHDRKAVVVSTAVRGLEVDFSAIFPDLPEDLRVREYPGAYWPTTDTSH